MESSKQYSLDKFSKLFNKEVNLTFEKGAFYAALLGLSSSFIIFILENLGVSHDFMIPGLWSFFCGLYALLLYVVARRGNINESNQYPLILLFVSLPSVIYILAYFGLPSKTATYITGPPSYIYIFLIIMTGFLFNRNISIFSGMVAGAEYFLIYLAARPYLVKLNCDDRIMLQDMTDISMYFFKSMIMVFSGIVVGILSDTAKRLISKALAEEHEKQNIDRLFGQYVSGEIKDKIIAEKKDIIGEIKNAAILFSDIRSFTTISESLPPDKVVVQLNEHLDKMVACINSEGGVIDKFIGDAIMATFGGVMDLDNPSEAAVRAAIGMRKALSALNDKWSAESRPLFDIGIGIHYGEVLQGSIGSASRKEFTVIGDTVNAASRIESITKEYKFPILISGAVYERLSDDFKKMSETIGGVSVKGKAEKIEVYGIRV